MKQFMEDDLESIRVLCEATRQNVDLPIARPACCHEAWGNNEPGSSGIPFYLELNFRTYPQRIMDCLRKVPGAVRGLVISGRC